MDGPTRTIRCNCETKIFSLLLLPLASREPIRHHIHVTHRFPLALPIFISTCRFLGLGSPTPSDSASWTGAAPRRSAVSRLGAK